MSEIRITTSHLHCWAIQLLPHGAGEGALFGNGCRPDHDWNMWPLGETAIFRTKAEAKPFLHLARVHFPKSKIVHVIVRESVSIVDGPTPVARWMHDRTGSAK